MKFSKRNKRVKIDNQMAQRETERWEKEDIPFRNCELLLCQRFEYEIQKVMESECRIESYYLINLPFCCQLFNGLSLWYNKQAFFMFDITGNQAYSKEHIIESDTYSRFTHTNRHTHTFHSHIHIHSHSTSIQQHHGNKAL